MIGIDTNVLLRATLRDDPEQATAADRLLSGCTPEQPAFISVPVICEYVWTLSRRVKLSRGSIANHIRSVIRNPTFRIQERDSVAAAFFRYVDGRVDFVDYLIFDLNWRAGATTTHTFDRDAGSEAGFTLLSPERA